MGDEEYRWCIRPVGAELLMQAARTASCLEAAGRSRSSPLVSAKRALSACESRTLVRLMGTQLSHHALVLQHLVSIFADWLLCSHLTQSLCQWVLPGSRPACTGTKPGACLQLC